MSKVECLRKIISKLTGGEIPDPELDTVCECLDKLAEVVSTAGGGGGTPGKDGKDGTKWFVVNDGLHTGAGAPEGAKVGDLVLESSGMVFEVVENSVVVNTGVKLKS